MPYFQELRQVPYGAEQMFGIVADIESYPAFLPWCVGARVLERRAADSHIQIERAELMVGFKSFRERYTSEVTLDHQQMTIRAIHVSGPFKHLNSQWSFGAQEDGTTQVGFTIDFAFRNPVLGFVADRFFSEAARRMIQAFEARAAVLYKPAI